MAIYNERLVDFAWRVCVLRNYVRTRKVEEKYQEQLLAGKQLLRHVQSVTAQLKGSLAMVMPLARHVRAYRGSIRAACRLQAFARVWCCEVLGLHSRMELLGDPMEGKPMVGRIHLSCRQKRDAITELQRAMRRAIASSDSRKLNSCGYSAVLIGASQLQGYTRAQRIRAIVQNLALQYGINMLQGQIRMVLTRKVYRKKVSCLPAFSLWLTFQAACSVGIMTYLQIKRLADMIPDNMMDKRLVRNFDAKLSSHA